MLRAREAWSGLRRRGIGALDVIARSSLTAALVVVVVYAILVIGQEKIRRGEGMGDDGYRYGIWAKDYAKQVLEVGLDGYHIQRVLPSTVAHLIMKATRLAPTSQNVVLLFEIMNGALVAAGAALWIKIADALSISKRPAARLLGLLFLFGGFGVAKWSAYYPVLGDLWGYVAGLAMLFCYLRGWRIGVGVIAAVFSFAWPTVIYAAIPLLLFGRDEAKEPSPSPSPSPSPPPARLNVVIAVIGAAVWAYLCVSVHDTGYRPGDYARTADYLFRPSVAVVAVAAFIAYARLLDDGRLFRPLYMLRRVASIQGLAGVALLVAARYFQARMATAPGFGVADHIKIMAYTMTTRPGIFLLAHVVFFGVPALLMFMRWRRFTDIVKSFGPGVTLALCAGATLGLGSESRHLFTFAALAIPFVLKDIDELELPKGSVLILAGLTALFSKVWFTLDDGTAKQQIDDWPRQGTFLNIGPWISMEMYLLQGAIVVAIAWWLYKNVLPPLTIRVAGGLGEPNPVEGPHENDSLRRSEGPIPEHQERD